MNSLSSLDWIVFSLILFFTFLVVFYGHKRKKGSDNFLDHLLMGRKLTTPLFTATLVATWYGGIFGVTQISFESGIYNFLTQGVFWYATYILMAFVFVSRIRKYNAVTLPDLVGKLYGPKAEKLSALFNFINVIPVAYAISLALLIQSLTSLSFPLGLGLGLIIVIFYSMFGGFRAVVFSDLFQFFIMCSAVALVLFFSLSEHGGLGFLQATLPKEHFSLLGKHSLWETMTWGLIALSTLVDPNFYQRIFAAESERVAKKGILIATVIWIFFDICTTAGGLYARAVLPQAQSNSAYLEYGLSLLPNGLRGFFLGGIVATILSTMDSYLFLAATTLSYDFFPKLRTKFGHHICLILSGALCYVLSSQFDGDIKAVWKTLGSYSAACLLIPVLIGQLRPRLYKENLFIAAVVISAVVTTLWQHIDLSAFGHWSELDEIYPGALTSLLIFFGGHLTRLGIRDINPA